MARQATLAAEKGLHDQTQFLEKKQVMFIFAILAIGSLFCFIDQNGIGVLLPTIARDLNAESTISWAGTSALIANTVCQVLYGRLSDLFGRKNILVSALVLLSLSDLACGLSVNATMLYIFRGLAGVANGGIMSLTMMIVSDIVSLQERGKYQGILGCMVGLGNAIGPLIASGFALHLTWRGLFYFLAPSLLVAAAVSWKYLPTNMPKLNYRETLAKIDGLGLLFGTCAVIFLLIPLSDGGHNGTPWDSPLVIAMFTVGGASLIAFLLVEWKWADLPMMPLDIWTRPSVAAMLAQSFLLGAAYFSYIYFLPLYFQNVRGKSALISACLQLPMVITQSSFSTMGGFYMSIYNRYTPIIWSGFGSWAIAGGLLIMADETIPLGLVSFFLIIMGVGTGFTFQPTMVALQAHCPKAQRAVIVSNRNFLRSFGGATGLAISSAILANVLKSSLPAELQSVASSTFATPNYADYSLADQKIIKAAYASASRAVFIWAVPLTGLCFLLTFFVKDNGLQREEERKVAEPTAEGEDAAVTPTEDLEKGVATPEELQSEHDDKEPQESIEQPADHTSSSRKASLSEKSTRSGD